MDYLEFGEWRNSHIKEMQDLTFARPDDIFIFTRYRDNKLNLEGKQVLFAESIEEVIGYIRHIFLYDIFNDATDDLETDFELSFDERQSDAILLLNYWFKLGKISADCSFRELEKFCNDFNSEFHRDKNTGYEIEVFNDADKLRSFLIKKFSDNEWFNKNKLYDICSKDLFVGRALKDFLDVLFNCSIV